MTADFNYVKCAKCEHDRNPSTAIKCEICGKPLRRGSFPLPLVGGLAALAIVGGGAFVFKDKLPGLGSSNTASSQNAATESVNKPVSSDNAPTQAAPNSSTALTSVPMVTGAKVETYRSLADVPNVPQGKFNYGGSTTFAPLRSEEINGAMKRSHSQFQLRYTQPTTGKPGSGKGIEMLLEGQLSFAESSRALKDKEIATAKNRGFALEQVPIAIDGIVFYINPQLHGQGLKGITLAQAKDIFTGKITNWRQVGGPNLAITPLTRNLEAVGTVDFFVEKVLDKQPLGSNVQEVNNTTLSIRKVATTPGAISYATGSEVVNQKMIRLLALSKETNQPAIAPCSNNDCTAINKAAFGDGSYPLTRRLFVILKRDGKLDEQAGVAYANLLLSDEVQKLIEQKGFVPIR